jgi:hypothetical protein
VAGSFWEKSTAGWWLISRTNRLKGTYFKLMVCDALQKRIFLWCVEFQGCFFMYYLVFFCKQCFGKYSLYGSFSDVPRRSRRLRNHHPVLAAFYPSYL